MITLLLGPWMLLYAACWGIGVAVTKILGLKDGERGPSLFWLGWAVAMGCLQVWHLFRPLGMMLLAMLSVCGIAGFFVAASEQATREKWKAFSRRWKRVAGTLAAAAVLAWFVNGAGTLYDTGLYHQQAEEWSRAFAAVPGIGNLHHRLAFNSSFHLCTGLLGVLLDPLRSAKVASGLLVFAMLVHIVVRWPPGKSAGPARVADGLTILLLPACTSRFFMTGTASPDLPVFIFGLALAQEFFGLEDEAGRRTRLVVMASLCAAGITVSLSFVVLATSVGLVTFVLHREERKSFLRCLLVAAFLLVPWVGRNVVLSGYLLFPAPALGLPVSWKVPPENARAAVSAIRGWAREPSRLAGETAGLGWVRGWLSRNGGLTTGLAACALGTLAIVVSVRAYRSRRLPVESALAAYLACLCGSVVFWFLAAPDPRFAGALFWLTTAVSLEWLVRTSGLTETSSRRVLVVSALVLTSGVVGRQAWDRYFFPVPRPPETVRTRVFTTESGLRVFIPATGDQCWSSPIPCTPEPSGRLRLRSARGGLQEGFMISTKEDEGKGGT